MNFKKLSYIFATLVLFGCASNSLNKNAASVVVVPDSHNVPASCTSLGLVEGSQGNILTINFTSGSSLSDGAINDLKNNAAQMGANYVQILTNQTDLNLHGYLPVLIALSSCATMNSDNTRTITIQSTPPGATAYYREESTPLGVTPGKITLPQYMYSEPVITLKKTGYKNVYIPIETNFSWSTLLNVYNFGVGFIVDASSGNVVHISDTSKVININMQPLSESAMESGIHIKDVLAVESASESK